jgi:hypothetical protein
MMKLCTGGGALPYKLFFGFGPTGLHESQIELYRFSQNGSPYKTLQLDTKL